MISPMMLAEFVDHTTAQMALYVGGILDMDESAREFRELALRLRAGERERCAATVNQIGIDRWHGTQLEDACDECAEPCAQWETHHDHPV